MALSIVPAVPRTSGGLTLAYLTDWPTTVWIVSLGCLVYFASVLRPTRAAPSG